MQHHYNSLKMYTNNEKFLSIIGGVNTGGAELGGVIFS